MEDLNPWIALIIILFFIIEWIIEEKKYDKKVVEKENKYKNINKKK